MTDVEKLLRDLVDAAQPETSNDIDVTSSVMKTLSYQRNQSRTDLTPIVFAGFTAVAALVFVFVVYSDWQAVSDPWASLSSR